MALTFFEFVMHFMLELSFCQSILCLGVGCTEIFLGDGIECLEHRLTREAMPRQRPTRHVGAADAIAGPGVLSVTRGRSIGLDFGRKPMWSSGVQGLLIEVLVHVGFLGACVQVSPERG